ncbi:ABC transporter substrate-binding protein [Rhodoferax sp. BAB1]|uniref:ABC transporter substrate-binding protein n=1 Tax=Rhodoferax sp. BAB1 TaxID=2741720 RepID=UPI0015775B8F|nr:ABC transporter substrate-binding protein [Rhodoferax sp. BAB1]QKO21347.1 ABC transporter substrate-binding protein [Rhodoferax sp. BAB1]
MNKQFFHRRAVTSLLCAAGLLLGAHSQAQNAWIVGQSAPLSGSNAVFGQDIRDGAQAYFKMINTQGGVAGAPVELLTLDDQNQRKIAGENTGKLLQTKGLVALFGYGSATLSLDAMPQAEKAGVLFYAPFSGANPVRKASPVVYTLRASYGDELEKMLAFWTSLGLKQVVVVHYDDEVGVQNLGVVTDYLVRQGKTPKAFALQRNAGIDAARMNALMALKPEVIINTVLSGPAADISKQLTARGLYVPMSSLSFVGAQQYIDAAGEAGAGASISQVVPNTSASLPIIRECGKALQDAGVKKAMNSTHLEACIGAKVLTEAMRRSKRPGDAKALLAALRNLGTYDVGGYTVQYGPEQNHGSKYVELAMVTRNGRLRN